MKMGGGGGGAEVQDEEPTDHGEVGGEKPTHWGHQFDERQEAKDPRDSGCPTQYQDP